MSSAHRYIVRKGRIKRNFNINFSTELIGNGANDNVLSGMIMDTAICSTESSLCRNIRSLHRTQRVYGEWSVVRLCQWTVRKPTMPVIHQWPNLSQVTHSLLQSLQCLKRETLGEIKVILTTKISTKSATHHDRSPFA